MTNAEPRPPRTVVFFHVMKCGGTSVRRSLADSAPRGRDDVFTLDGSAAMAAVGGLVHQAENWRFRAELLGYLLHGNPPPVIMGHFRYANALEQFLDRSDFVTVLRPPVERLVSLYRYRHFSGREEGIAAPPSLAATLADPGWVPAGHHYVETFCGDPALDPRSDEAIDSAIANLGRFRVVGHTDDMAGFASRVTQACGRTVEVNRKNSSPAPDDHVDDATELSDELAAFCGPDQRVYDAVFGR